jgi:L-arabinonolactonase
MDLGSNPVLALDCRNNLGESIIWDERDGRLWWANIHEGEVWSWDPAGTGGPRVSRFTERVGAIGLRQGRGLALALESGFAVVEREGDLPMRLVNIEPELDTTRLNDGRIDPAGRFVCGGMDESSPQRAISSVYSLDRSGRAAAVIGGVSCANSICWSPDGRIMYFTDMPSRRIDQFDYDPATGAVGNRRIFADLSSEPGLADGSTVDAEGYLWNAQWGGSKVVRYAPDGSVDREVELPVSNPTCLCFGGPDLDVLFITSAWFGLDEVARAREVQAGGIFALRPGVKGLPEHRYAG